MDVRLPRLLLYSAFTCAALTTFVHGAELPKKPLHQDTTSRGGHIHVNKSTGAKANSAAIHYPHWSRHHFNDHRQPSFRSLGPAFMR